MVEEEVAQDRVEDARDVGARALWQQKALLLVHVQLVGLSVSARKRRGGETSAAAVATSFTARTCSNNNTHRAFKYQTERRV